MAPREITMHVRLRVTVDPGGVPVVTLWARIKVALAVLLGRPVLLTVDWPRV
jgi:hypothetical protein